MKKKQSVIVSLLLVCVLSCSLFLLSACGGQKPFDTIKRFAGAYNKLDYNEMLKCCDPRIIGVLQEVGGELASLLGAPSVSGDANDAATSLMLALLGEYANEYWDERGVSIEMQVREIATKMNGKDDAQVTVEFTVKSSSGQTERWQQTLSMVKIDDAWYITLGLDDLAAFL